MNKKRLAIGVSILLGVLTLVVASAMYAGECLPVNLSELKSLDNVVYDVIGNSSNLEGLTIELNGTIANICTVPNYKPDSFTIIFIDNSTKEIVKEVPVYRSGGTRKIYIENKTIVEVPNYIDREVIKEIDKEVPEPEIIEKIPNQVYWFIGFLIVVIFALILLVLTLIRHVKRLKKSNKDKLKSGKLKNE